MYSISLPCPEKRSLVNETHKNFLMIALNQNSDRELLNSSFIIIFRLPHSPYFLSIIKR